MVSKHMEMVLKHLEMASEDRKILCTLFAQAINKNDA
jgi:hypothetical protein